MLATQLRPERFASYSIWSARLKNSSKEIGPAFSDGASAANSRQAMQAMPKLTVMRVPSGAYRALAVFSRMRSAHVTVEERSVSGSMTINSSPP